MWSSIIGHLPQIERLQRALKSNQLAQAYLFTGPRGVGKALVARALAMACIPSSATRGEHPDIIWLRVLPDKSEISMEQWRAVEGRVQFQALEGERKLIIIDDAELMSASVANACLKTLEEPPANTHFILIAHDSDRLLPTIRSRCQQMVFAPLSHEVVSQWIKSQGVEPALADRAARLSQGSFQRAQKLANAEVLAKLDSLVADLQQGMTPIQILKHSTTLATTDELPELLDGVTAMLRDGLVDKMNMKSLRRIRAAEQASQFLSMKGANKELILNEMFITLAN